MWHLVEKSGQYIHKVQMSVNPKHKKPFVHRSFLKD